MPEFKPDEIIQILASKGISAEEVQAMTDAYENKRVYAVKNQLSPVHNFCNLIELADNQLKVRTVTVPSLTVIVPHSLFKQVIPWCTKY